jgi:hypothetical protein
MNTPCRCSMPPVAVRGRPDLCTCPACGVCARAPAGQPAPEPATIATVKVDPATFREVKGPGSPAPDWPGTPGHTDPGPTVTAAPVPARRGRTAGSGG